MVLALAGDDLHARERAVDAIIECYWRPLYKFARVAWRQTKEEAEDATQSFFVRALEKETLATYDPARGGFRPFLRALFERHLANEWKASRRVKRGGEATRLDFDDAEREIARETGGTPDPGEYFQREWVRAVFSIAVERLREACIQEGKTTQFALFEAYDLDGDRALSYRELAARHDIVETQVTNQLAWARRRFRGIVLEQLRELTASDAEFRAEARALLGVTL